MLLCEESAAEVAQEAYLRILRYARHKPLINPRAYLFQVAANLARTRLKQGKSLHLYDNNQALLNDVECPLQNTERFVIARQKLELLSQTIQTLPPRCREVFLLSRLDGLSHSQIAGRLGISLNMVEKHIIKALLRCRQSINLEEQ
jgi:RNA polymerase sigma-70 factor (ECF subfamily)